MKKFLTLIAVLALAVPAFGQGSPEASDFNGADTILNDDSCDVGVTPAATLLLPYFEVDFEANQSEAVNTIFSITNTSRVPQIAHITIWTDWSVPVIDFNIFLTGYDVQPISLYNIIARGEIPPTSILGNAGTVADHGPLSLDNDQNGQFKAATVITDCTNLPGPIPGSLLDAIQSALTGGPYGFFGGASCPQVGGMHDNAVGYVTIDTARTCSTTLPNDPSYFTAAGDIAHQNVLIGDYQHFDPTSATGEWGFGNEMVHIRAIPEFDGITVFTGADVTFPYTFYRRYTDNAIDDKADRRMPLPGVWAARYIEEEEGVGQDLSTDLVIWREGVNDGSVCATVDDNGEVPLTEIVRFDESENPTTLAVQVCRISPCPPGAQVSFPETGAWPTDMVATQAGGPGFPEDNAATDDLGGWMYLNLNHGALGANYPTRPDASQNWVTVQMTAEGRLGAEFNAAWLGNGCSPNPGVSQANGGAFILGPLP